jgi:AcrR family transcriptional regulator
MRGKLAQSAFELFAQRGIKNVNLDEVAAHAGVTKGSLYWHYKSKKEVVLAACAYYYRRWQQRAHAEIARDSDPFGQLQRVLRFGVQSCLFDRDNRVFTTEVFALSLQDSEIRASWAQFYDTVRELIVGLVQAARAHGQIDVADPYQAVTWMMDATEGIKQRASFEPEICTPEQRETFVQGMLQILTHVSASAVNV